MTIAFIIFVLLLYSIYIIPILKITKHQKDLKSETLLEYNGVQYKTPSQALINLENSDEDLCVDGLFLGDENIFQDCRKMCNNNTMEYLYLSQDGEYINRKNRRLHKGAWCLPSQSNICNLNISTIVQINGRWRCNPKYNLFGGGSGNQIMKCNGRLRDNRIGKVYVNYVPPDFKLESLDEKTIVDGKEMYAIECDMVDNNIGNALVLPPLENRFELISNYCTKYLNAASRTIVPDFDKHECNCEATESNVTLSNLFNNPSRACVPCKSQYSENKITLMSPCFGGNLLVNDLNSNEVMFPCGEDDFPDTRVSCIEAQIETTASIKKFY